MEFLGIESNIILKKGGGFFFLTKVSRIVVSTVVWKVYIICFFVYL